jgi:hypothetical protein
MYTALGSVYTDNNIDFQIFSIAGIGFSTEIMFLRDLTFFVYGTIVICVPLNCTCAPQWHVCFIVASMLP